jgi:peptidoglycan/LPS O-acetylase OafA/YrhL
MKDSLSGIPSFESHYGGSLNIYAIVGIISVFFLVILLVSLRKTRWFGQRRWVMLGALTYPLYLIHQNIGYMMIDRTYPALNPHAVFWGTVFIVLAVSFAINFLVERPASGPFRRLTEATLDRGARCLASGIDRFRARGG